MSNEVVLASRLSGFSGVDIKASIWLPPHPKLAGVGGEAYMIGSIQTISYSVFSSKEAVRSLGFKMPMGYARGGRTIAGTLVFNQLLQHPFDDVGMGSAIHDATGILTYSSGAISYHGPLDTQEIEGVNGIFEPLVRKRLVYDFSWDQRTLGTLLHPSDLPPFDIIVVFVNEYGNIGKMILYGVDLVHEASVLSIEDIYTEVTYQFVARDIEYFHAESWDQTVLWQSEVLMDTIPLRVSESLDNTITGIVDRFSSSVAV